MGNLQLIGFKEENLYVLWQKCNGIHLMHSFLEAIIISLKDQIRGIIKRKKKQALAQREEVAKQKRVAQL